MEYPMIKAIENGDSWELEVLGVPYGGPYGGKDAQGEYFTPETELWLDRIPKRPVVYYHGLSESNSAPEIIGEELGWQKKADGVWFRVALNKASKLAQRVWEAAKNGVARASSGAIGHLTRVDSDGRIRVWPMGELSLLDLDGEKAPVNPYAVASPVIKAVYEQAGLDWPDEYNDDPIAAEDDPEGATAQGATSDPSEEVASEQTNEQTEDLSMSENENTAMTPEEIREMTAEAVKAALAERDKQDQAKAEADAAVQEQINEAVKAEKAKWEDEIKASGRLPFNGDNAPVIGEFGDLRKYDSLSAGDLAINMAVFDGLNKPLGENAFKALVYKLNAETSEGAEIAKRDLAVKGLVPVERQNNGRLSIKANEVNYSTLASGGNEWASNVLAWQSIWESIRHETRLAGQIPSIEIPQGYESVHIPLEGADPTFYKVAQVTGDAATGGLSRPSPTVTSSKLTTAEQTLTLAKMGARVRYAAELEEDSIPMFGQMLAAQIRRAAAEQFEVVLIDGDTNTTASTNINDIADASAQAGTELYLIANGMRKLALVTNTANSRSGGAVDEDDFVATRQLLGAAGKNARNPQDLLYVMDPNVYWKLFTNVTALKTADVYPGAPTIENGVITNIWGTPVYPSWSMHWATRASTGYEYQANTAGKLDQGTASNNTTGTLLCVRPDQWMIGYKRQLKVSVQYEQDWDGYELVALMRFGLVYRDTDAAAATYNITV